MAEQDNSSFSEEDHQRGARKKQHGMRHPQAVAMPATVVEYRVRDFGNAAMISKEEVPIARIAVRSAAAKKRCGGAKGKKIPDYP